MDTIEHKYQLKRYDLSVDHSLRPFSAADEYLLQKFLSLEKPNHHLGIYHDRFGFLACYLNASNPTLILTQKSQEKAIRSNLKANGLSPVHFSNPLSPLEKKMEVALMKIPKSFDLFQLFLEHISQNSKEEVMVIAAFMTRHFSPKLLKIAQKYFEEVEQSRALKKARLLMLSKKKTTTAQTSLHSINYKNQDYQQYPGVFSADHIDYATQYLLEQLEIRNTDQCILDLGAGNGIIGKELSQQLPAAEIHLMDDSYLAVESAKLNIQGNKIHHHYNNDLSIFDDETFDVIVSNPPFHFEYEINIQVPIQLFRDCFRCLKKGGNLQLVSNKHLNYKVHLDRFFSSVQVLEENQKFIVYKCVK